MRINAYRQKRCYALLLLALLACSCGRAIFRPSLASTAGNAGEANPVVYVSMGDSTCVGFGAREGGYAQRLFTRIRHKSPGASLNNLCRIGATTADVLRDQTVRVAGARPTLITLGVGANDLLRNVPPEQFEANYENIVIQLKGTGASVVLMNLPDISLAPGTPGNAREETLRRVLLFNKTMESIARRHALPLLDLFATTRESIPQHPEFFSSDGVHPSDEGYEFWADSMWPGVEAAIKW